MSEALPQNQWPHILQGTAMTKATSLASTYDKAAKGSVHGCLACCYFLMFPYNTLRECTLSPNGCLMFCVFAFSGQINILQDQLDSLAAKIKEGMLSIP